MSIRSEIRASLVDGPKTVDELLPLVPSVEGDRRKLGFHMNNLASEKMVRRSGLSDDGKPIYKLDPEVWPLKETAAAPPPKSEATPAAAKPAKATKPAKKTRPASTAEIPAPAKARKAKQAKSVKAAKPAKVARKSPSKTKIRAAKSAKKRVQLLAEGTAIIAAQALRNAPADPVTANAVQIGGTHYQALDPQPWDVISAWNLSFLAGNVVKYVARAPAKGGIEDLHKARHYLDKLIETHGATA